MRLASLLCAALLSLAACGADAPPLTPDGPEDGTPGTALTISGEARIGVVGTF